MAAKETSEPLIKKKIFPNLWIGRAPNHPIQRYIRYTYVHPVTAQPGTEVACVYSRACGKRELTPRICIPCIPCIPFAFCIPEFLTKMNIWFPGKQKATHGMCHLFAVEIFRNQPSRILQPTTLCQVGTPDSFELDMKDATSITRCSLPLWKHLLGGVDVLSYNSGVPRTS